MPGTPRARGPIGSAAVLSHRARLPAIGAAWSQGHGRMGRADRQARNRRDQCRVLRGRVVRSEVLQFFLIVLGFLPLVLLGLKDMGGWGGLTAKLETVATNAGYSAGAWSDRKCCSSFSSCSASCHWCCLVSRTWADGAG